MIHRGVSTYIDNFDRPLDLTAGTSNGWAIKDTSSGGTPSFVNTAIRGGSFDITLAATSEAEIVTLYHEDLLSYDIRDIEHIWLIAKVSGIDSVTTLVMGLGSEQDDTADDVTTNAWFRMEGSASTSNAVAETDSGSVDNNDVASGKTLSTTYKKMLVDLSAGLADVKFYFDGERVAETTTFDMSALSASGDLVQPFVQLQKASGTGTPAVSLFQFGMKYRWQAGV